MEHYCAYRERCHKEVQTKLKSMHMIPEAINHIIHHLIQHNYLNESRFAKAFARGKFRNKKWGKQRIVSELRARDISTYNIQLALTEIPESDYLITFHALAEKRFEQIKDETDLQKQRRKLADYLRYRGWESELVWEKIRELTL